MMPSVNILGVHVSPWDVQSLTDAITSAGRGSGSPFGERQATIHYANVHVLNTAYTDQALREQLNRGSTVYCDGAGVRLGALLLGRRLPPRLTAADWIDSFCGRAAEEGIRLFLLGSAEGVAGRAADVLQRRYTQLKIAGTHHGFLDVTSSKTVVERMNATRADVVLVGMGTPVQEHWIARHRPDIAAPVVWAVGALFDFVAGVQTRAPVWLTDRGMEWAWRWVTDPKRLTKRYLIGNPLFCLRVARQRLLGLPRV